MKKHNITNRLATVTAVAALGLSTVTAFSPVWAATTTTASGMTSTSTSTDATRLAAIKAKGAAEITRRLASLNKAASKINGLTKLTASDKAYLSSEVSTEIGGLISLQSKLANDTTVSAAKADVQSIYTDYRVYALVLPKVWLVKTADGQQVTEGNLTTLATKLQMRIDKARASAKEVTQLQAELNDMEAQTRNAQAISSDMEQKVLMLQPSDYNSDHTILSGDVAQLKTAHSDNQAAYQDAKNIVAALKRL